MAYLKHIIWSPSAQKDLENIIEYLISEWGKKVAEKFLFRITKIIDQIKINPKQYPKINTELNVRKCVITKQNTLFYRVINNYVEIIRIYDTRQDPEKQNILFG